MAPNTSSGFLQVALRYIDEHEPHSLAINVCETFGKFVLLKLIVQSQASAI